MNMEFNLSFVACLCMHVCVCMQVAKFRLIVIVCERMDGNSISLELCLNINYVSIEA